MTVPWNSPGYNRGLQFLIDLVPDAEARLDQLLPGKPDLLRYAVEFIFGELHQRPALTLREREIATIAIMTTLGGCEESLSNHMAVGVAAGLTRDEILEIILVCAAYAGFTRASIATKIATRVLDSLENTATAS